MFLLEIMLKLFKNRHGFDIIIRLNGNVSKQMALSKIDKFVQSVPEFNHDIKFIAIFLNGYEAQDSDG